MTVAYLAAMMAEWKVVRKADLTADVMVGMLVELKVEMMAVMRADLILLSSMNFKFI